jgi:hypothetical protein
MPPSATTSRSQRFTAPSVLFAILCISQAACLGSAATAFVDASDLGDAAATAAESGSSSSRRDAPPVHIDTDSEAPGDAAAVDAPAEAAAQGDAATSGCKNATGAQLACATCYEAACASEVTATTADCATFYPCFDGCDCSDTACIDTCAAAASSTCQGALQALVSCQQSQCASSCGSSADGGAPGTDATTDAASDASTDATTPPTCKNPNDAFQVCWACEQTSCGSALSAEERSCGSFNACFAGCDCSDTSCIDACSASATTACQGALSVLATCQKGSCSSACTTDAGADGGTSTGGIPDCTDPTSEEQSLYETCSACDNQSCSQYVQSAVAACEAYYACFSSTSCLTAVTVCSIDSNPTCDMAVSELATCQETFCFFDCSGL